MFLERKVTKPQRHKDKCLSWRLSAIASLRQKKHDSQILLEI